MFKITSHGAYNKNMQLNKYFVLEHDFSKY